MFSSPPLLLKPGYARNLFSFTHINIDLLGWNNSIPLRYKHGIDKQVPTYRYLNSMLFYVPT